MCKDRIIFFLNVEVETAILNAVFNFPIKANVDHKIE